MGEAFKEFINSGLIEVMARELEKAGRDFDGKVFRKRALEGLGALELKERVYQVSHALEAALPADYERALEIMEVSLAPVREGDEPGELRSCDTGLAGWAIWPMTEFVARCGQGARERSLEALRQLTQRFSAEFAVRPFLAADPQGTLSFLGRWLKDPSAHVRRWLSEGTRPRLPWGMRLDCFIEDPRACWPILRHLHDDPSEYVRRSVANHLNDISKDHPELAVEYCAELVKLGATTTEPLVKHALRSLVKHGHPGALSLLGFGGGSSIRCVKFELSSKRLKIGEVVGMSIELRNAGRQSVKVVADYAVHYLRANGSHSRKVFKGSNLQLPAGETQALVFNHRFKDVTVRRHYPGKQGMELLVNGSSLAREDLHLRA
jgi:3-methyladenine DNA glycosylase AlkC